MGVRVSLSAVTPAACCGNADIAGCAVRKGDDKEPERGESEVGESMEDGVESPKTGTPRCTVLLLFSAADGPFDAAGVMASPATA